MPSSISSKKDFEYAEKRLEANVDTDDEFGGHEARKQLEKKLLRKLDLRMSILIVIYILNYVRPIHRSSNKVPDK